MPDDSPATKSDLAALEERLSSPLVWPVKELRDYFDERTRDVQTELLRAFRIYQEEMAVKMAKLSSKIGSIATATDRRLNIVEERLSELERRIAEKGL